MSKSVVSAAPAAVVAPVAAPAAAPAPVMLVALTETGKTKTFRTGSQRDVWFTSLRAYEGKPVADWLTAVALKVPAQRAKENAKTPHKSGHGFLNRFKELGLVTLVPQK
jgi:hypothetical protein